MIPAFSKAGRQSREVADERVVSALFARHGMEQKVTKVFCTGLAGARPSDCKSTRAQPVLVRAFPSDGERLMSQALNAHQSLQVIQSLERAGFLRRAEADYSGNGRPALRWDVNPALIGVTLAETAETPAA
jgi:hypothetical protein